MSGTEPGYGTARFGNLPTWVGVRRIVIIPNDRGRSILSQGHRQRRKAKFKALEQKGEKEATEWAVHKRVGGVPIKLDSTLH